MLRTAERDFTMVLRKGMWVGSRESGIGNRGSGIGNRESGVRNPVSGVGDREPGVVKIRSLRLPTPELTARSRSPPFAVPLVWNKAIPEILNKERVTRIQCFNFAQTMGPARARWSRPARRAVPPEDDGPGKVRFRSPLSILPASGNKAIPET
jgi:hypothetical protein